MAGARIPALVPTQFRHLAQSAERLPSNANMSRTFCLGAHHGVGPATGLPQRVYLSLQPAPHSDSSVPYPPWTRQPASTHNLQLVVHCGVAGEQNARYYYMTRRLVGAGGGTTVPPEALIGPIGLVATTRSSNKTSYGVPTSL